MKLNLTNKFLFPTIALIIIGMTASAMMSYFSSKQAIEDMAANEIRRVADSASNHLMSWFKFIQLNMSSWSEEMPFKTAVLDTFLGESARETASERLLKIKEDYGMFDQLILFNTAGEAIAAADPNVIGKVNVSDREFFQESLKGNVFISDVLKSKVTGMPIFVISAPVMQYEESVGGVLAGSVPMAYFSKAFIEPVKIGKTGYAYMYDSDGLIIAHPDKENILKMNISEFDADGEMLKTEQGSLIYTLGGMKKMTAFKKIPGTGWFVGVTAHTAELLEPVKNIRYIAVLFSIGVCVLAGAVIFFVARSVTTPVQEVVRFAKALSDGDLCSAIHIKNQDEIGEMAESLNHALHNLRSIISELTNTAKNLANSSEELSSLSAQMASSSEEMNSQADMAASASEQVTASVAATASATEQSGTSLSNIASMTEELSAAFNNIVGFGKKTADNVSKMARSSEDISAQINSVASASEEMTVSLNEVAKHTAQANRISQNASRRTEQVDSRITTLVASSKQIGKIVEVIKDIADQTNMLALNATIEAAGAGEAGKGFAVVASEVKELAKQSADATDEIAGQVEEIRASTDGVADAVQEISQVIAEIAAINEMIASSVEEQTATASEISKSVSTTAVTVKTVAESAGESAKLVGEIAGSTDEISQTVSRLAGDIDELLNRVEEVVRSSGEASGGVNEISKNIQGISDASRQVAEGASKANTSSKELAEMASSLAQIVGRFNCEN
jgi:methyl-accepting chemotaxis protein